MSVKEDLMRLPAELRQMETDAYFEKKKIDALHNNLKSMEASFIMAVQNAKDKDGKNLHSNQASRDNAVILIKSKDENYNVIKEKLKEKDDSLANMERQIKFLSRRLSAAKYLAMIAIKELEIKGDEKE